MVSLFINKYEKLYTKESIVTGSAAHRVCRHVQHSRFGLSHVKGSNGVQGLKSEAGASNANCYS